MQRAHGELESDTSQHRQYCSGAALRSNPKGADQKPVNLNLDSCRSDSDRHELVVRIRFGRLFAHVRGIWGHFAFIHEAAFCIKPFLHTLAPFFAQTLDVTIVMDALAGESREVTTPSRQQTESAPCPKSARRFRTRSHWKLKTPHACQAQFLRRLRVL